MLPSGRVQPKQGQPTRSVLCSAGFLAHRSLREAIGAARRSMDSRKSVLLFQRSAGLHSKGFSPRTRFIITFRNDIERQSNSSWHSESRILNRIPFVHELRFHFAMVWWWCCCWRLFLKNRKRRSSKRTYINSNIYR